ncbi:DUF5776 domain-containing protein, partial [Apilactobacillus micheneri]|uniref:DUF5776 domain-containing protein n=1 Tax=Apilactobacillus micheneri TaxID=1899430 RepID=UPI001CDB6B8F
AAYNAGSAARDGMNDAQAGNQANAGKHQDNDADKQAYANAQAAYKAGQNGDPSNSADAQKNSAAYNAGSAARDGMNDAQAGNQANAGKHQDNDADKQAYANAQAAYKAGQNGDPSNSADAQKNSAAYNAGSAARDGMNDAQAGNQANAGKHQDNDADKQAYDNAQKAYQAGLNGQSTTDKNYQLNPTAGQAGQDAQAGIADGIGGKLSDKNYQNDPSYQQAYKDSQLARQGANDAINGNPENNSDKDNPAYDNAYKAVKNNTNLNGQNKTLPNVITQAAQAAQQGRKDAQNGNNLADPKNKNDANNPYYNGQWTPTQKQNYDNAQTAYNAGNNGDTTSDNARKNYDANQNGYNNYLANQSSQPASPNNNDDTQAGQKAGQQAFVGGNPLNINNVNLAGKTQAFKNAFTKAYNDSQAGFDAGLNGNKDNSDNSSFNAGYKSAQDYKQGVSDATNGKKPAMNSSDAYKVGYNAYKDGISGKNANKDTLDKLAPAYRRAYENNYQAAHKEYVAVSGKASKAARKNAVGNKSIPRGLKHESPAYQTAYMEAFNRYVKDNLPSYVYNLKKIYSHNAPALTRHTRVNKYAKTPRYARHAFKVLGYKITSSGNVVYKVRGLGWISASDKSVDNLYYRHHDTKKPIQKIRVIKPQGTYIYNNKTFNKKTAVKKMKKGSVIKVERIEKVGSITRFYIGDGKYISSNKTIVEHIR